jgi:hypothetical protein
MPFEITCPDSIHTLCPKRNTSPYRSQNGTGNINFDFEGTYIPTEFFNV